MKTNFSFDAPGCGQVIIDLIGKRLYNTASTEDLNRLKADFNVTMYYSSRTGLSYAGFIRHHSSQIFLVLETGKRAEFNYNEYVYPYMIDSNFGLLPKWGDYEPKNSAWVYNPNFPVGIGSGIKGIISIVHSPEALIEMLVGGNFVTGGIQQQSVLTYLSVDNGDFGQFTEYWIQEGLEKTSRDLPRGINFPKFWKTTNTLLNFEKQKCYGDIKKFPTSSSEDLYPFIKRAAGLHLEDLEEKVYSVGVVPPSISEWASFGQAWGKGQYNWNSGWSTMRNFAWKVQQKAGDPSQTRVYAVFEIKSAELSGRFADVVDEYVEYEEYFDVLTWATKTPIEWRGIMRKKAFEKAVNEFRINRKHSRDRKRKFDATLKAIENNLETVLTVQDSYAVGNCEPGTNHFLGQYSLPESATCAELLQHKDIKKILENQQFQNVVLKKFGVTIEISAKIEEDVEEDIELDELEEE